MFAATLAPWVPSRSSGRAAELCRVISLTLWAAGELTATGGTNAPAVSGEFRGWSLPLRQDGELKAQLAGATMRRLPSGEMEVRDLRIETFREGENQAELTSPLCWYRPDLREVHSTNDFVIRQSGGKGEIRGTGFLLKLDTHEVSSAGEFTGQFPGGRGQFQGQGFWTHLETRRTVISNRVQALLPLPLPKRNRP